MNKMDNIKYVASLKTIFKYIDIEGGEEMLKNSTLLFNNSRNFNDPFDCYTELIDFSGITNEYLSKTHKNKYPYVKRQQRREYLRSLTIKEKEEISEHLKNQALNNKILNYGISCFSKKEDNILMWSHYSKNHEGLCVGFNLEKLFKYIKSLNYSINAPIFQINYVDEFNATNFFSNQKDALFNLFSTKSKCWEYEKEIRIMLTPIDFNKEGKFLLNFSNHIIDEIIIGTNCDFNKINNIVKNYPNAKIYKMEMSKNSFTLNKNLI